MRLHCKLLHRRSNYRVGLLQIGTPCSAHRLQNRKWGLYRQPNPHLNGVSGLVLDTHGCLGDAGTFAVFLAELCKHVRLLAFIVAFAAVLLPQQGQCNTTLCQLTVNVRIVRFNVQASTLVLVREEHLLQVCVGNVIVKGHWMPCLSISAKTSRTVCREQ